MPKMISKTTDPRGTFLRIAVTDDLDTDRKKLKTAICAFFSCTENVSCEITTYASGEEMHTVFSPGMFDLAFLDIRMEGMSGIELAKKLRALDTKLFIVFLTSSAEYAFDAFPVHPFDYLMKPFDESTLNDLLREVLRVMETPEPELAVRTQSGTLSVLFSSVCSLTSRGHAVDLQLANGQTIACSNTFTELSEAVLTDPRFLPCNRGIIVNMDHVLWISQQEATVVMTGRVRITTMAFLIMVPPFFWLLYHGAWWITTRLNESARVQIENDMLQMEGKRYRELRGYTDETRALRHDFRQHLNIISGLFRSGQTEKLDEYLKQYSENISDTHTVYCKNRTVDAIASHYDSIAKSQDTRIAWSLNLPEELPVLETDYCAVFGNLVENALRAVKKLPPESREISVTSQMLSDLMLGISIKNPYEGELSFGKNGLPRSLREGHGIGLTSVKNTAGKYHGSLDITASGGIFSAFVLMNRAAGQTCGSVNVNTH